MSDQEELKKKYLAKLEEEHDKARERMWKFYNEIQAFNHASNSSFFRIIKKDDMTYTWEADIMRGLIDVEL